MRANPLTGKLPGERDRLGRLKVDPLLRIAGVPHAFAAGDVANIAIDGAHPSVMSCQHGRPMGRFAGNNAAADLLGKPMLPLRIDRYVTVLDLGPRGGVYTSGWDRQVVATGAPAKATKQEINWHRIYPPRSLNREDLLAAAAPEVQPPLRILGSSGARRHTSQEAAPAVFTEACYAVFSNSSRPISMRLISLVPAPIS